MPSMLGLVRRDADEIRELRPRTALGALVGILGLSFYAARGGKAPVSLRLAE